MELQLQLGTASSRCCNISTGLETSYKIHICYAVVVVVGGNIQREEGFK